LVWLFSNPIIRQTIFLFGSFTGTEIIDKFFYKKSHLTLLNPIIKRVFKQKLEERLQDIKDDLER